MADRHMRRAALCHRQKERQDGRAVGAAFPSCPALCGYNSVFISFASVGRHFPKNIALQSENPSR